MGGLVSPVPDSRRVQDDQALAVILAMKKARLCGEDAFYRMPAKAPPALAWSERDLYAAFPAALIAE